MNKICVIKWSKVRLCWVVCSELSKRKTKKGVCRTLMAGVMLAPLLAFANDVTISQDTSIDLGANDQTLLNARIDVTNGAEVEVDARTDSIQMITIGSGSGLTVSDGAVRVNGKLGLDLTGSGVLSVSGPNSRLYIDNLYNISRFYTQTGGIFNVSDGGRVNVKERIDVDYEQGTISGVGSQLNAKEFFLGNSSDSRGDMSLSVKDGGELNASKNIALGYFDQNSRSTLIVSNKGKVSTEQINLGPNSELALGGREGESAQKAGIIDADRIAFVASQTSDKKITLNHTDNNAVISSDISSGSMGLGQVNAFSGTTWLTGDNSAFSGSVDIKNGAAVGITQNLGSADITNNGQLLINASGHMVLGNDIYGQGEVSAINGQVSLLGDNSTYSGNISVEHNAKVTLADQKNLGVATLFVDGILQLNSTSDWLFSNKMSGSGILEVNTANNIFSFSSDRDVSSFTGAVDLRDAVFNLENTDTLALKNASLVAGIGSYVNVGVGEQSINGLIFDGGSVNFNSVTQGAEKTDSQIKVTNRLDISSNGVVQVSKPTDVDGVPQVINSSLPLLELDDSNATIKLVDATAGAVVGDGGSLKLQDASGQVITSHQEQDVIRDGKPVAKGTYDFRLTSGVDQDGLYIGYGLTQLDLLSSGADALELDANGKTGNAADMSARITGAGDLAFNSQKGETVSLSNQYNDYTGVTDIRGGNVLMNSNSALGQTSEIRLAADTMLDMNGHSQTAGKLNGTAGSVLNINGGNLTLTSGGVSAGTLTGSGSLNLSSGEFIITGASSALTATTTVGEKATVKVHDNDGLGTGTVNTAGTLILGKPDFPVMLTSSQVNITENGTLSGYGGVAGNVANSGTLDLRADAPGNVLTVGGNYTGNNGTLLMNTVLGDDRAATDKLVIKGDASGQTRVAITNAGGTGAQTLNGIELIHVDGNADSAEFVQVGRIAAGAYDYTLGRGQGSNSGNWYLTSGKNTPDPDTRPEPAPGGYDNDLRPEAGSYTANMAAANTMFVTRLHERLGPMQYTDVMTGETKNTSMWMRHEGGHNRWRDGTGQLKTQGNRYVVQLGGDIAQWGWGETDRWHLGVMAGYGNEHNNTDSVRTGYRSKGSVNGYSTGLYATWFANDETHNGAYLDTWAQYGWFDNHVKGDGLPGESWKSKGLTASLETGYTWKAGEFSGSHGSLNEWYVQPQAQVVWMGVKADEHRESNGTRVESTGDGNVRTRLGVKTWIKGHNRMDDGKSREFRPFVEVNWLHNTRDFGTRMNGVTVHQDGARNIGEVKAGVEGQINDRLNLWGNVGVQAGDKGYSDTSAMLGVKYTF